jgi:hypothetical protein
MKLSAYITLAAIIGITTMQTASAQESRGARFNFEPNKWRGASPKAKEAFEPMHNVQAGSVPTSDILGVDPTMLAKPQPQAQPQPIQMPIVITKVTPQIMAPKTTAKTNFNPAFGKPTLAQLPAPIVPQQAVAQPIAPIQPAAAQPAQAAKPIVRTAVQAHLLRTASRPIKPATAAPAIASYPTNFGYVPGQMLAHNASVHTNKIATSVNGVLLSNHHQ